MIRPAAPNSCPRRTTTRYFIIAKRLRGSRYSDSQVYAIFLKDRLSSRIGAKK